MISDKSSKQAFVRRMFDDISERYDFLNTVLSLGQDRFWRRRAVADMPADGIVIDLCAGGGEMAREIFKRNNFAGQIVMIDISFKMLSLIRKIIPPVYLERCHIVICDAENLPFKNGIFAGAVSAFCLRNLSDLGVFTNEVRRVLMDRGLVRHLEIAHPNNKLLAGFFGFYFYKLSPLMARLFTSKSYAYRYLPASLKNFPRQNEVERILGQGWNSISHENLRGGIAAIYTLRKGK